MTGIKGPATGYRITPHAQDQGTALTNKDVHASSSRAGEASAPKVAKALDSALADGRLTLQEFEGGRTERFLRTLGVDGGSSVLGAMRDDGLLAKNQIDPVDYRDCQRLLERAQLPAGHPDHITLDAGVPERLGKVVDEFQARMLKGPQAGAFIEKIQDEKLGPQKVVNQTAMTLAPVDTGTFLDRLPPERWAEECYDLKSLHNQVLDRQELPDGGYQVTMLQRMEFGDGGTATDMTKRTVVRKWRDADSGQWHATAEWKVYSSDPTSQIPHAGSMRIDTGRMEFKPVQKDGRWHTEVLFNNATQTNTATEEKLLGLLGKNTPLRQNISAQLGASPLGITPFASSVVERYRDVGSGQTPPRWQGLATHTE
ncbi:MAG: hypothetical protein ABIJ09_15900 [Pseudomonadota bacterium]